jgi:ribosomal protein S12 methylthiotransferase accessory factor
MYSWATSLSFAAAVKWHHRTSKDICSILSFSSPGHYTYLEWFCFHGGACVDAHFGPYTIHTDQPPHSGGAGSAPTPFATFLASIGTCAGIYVLGFCQRRDIPTDGLRLVEHVETDPATGMLGAIRLDIELPAGFPERYRDAVIRAAEQCAAKQHFEHPPKVEIRTVASALAHKSQ